MKVRSSNSSKTYNFPPIGYQPPLDATRTRSQYHIRARNILKEAFPIDLILEEVPIPDLNLFFDFVIIRHKLCVEVHGEQHYTFNSFFFKDKFSWAKAQQNDQKKRDWCEENNLKLIELPFDKTDDEWKKILNLK
jgi:hypothetical protein